MNKKKERFLLLFWFIINLAIGLCLVQQYGLSYDEPDFYRYADYSLEAYYSFFGLLFEPDYGFGNLQYYGPAFIILVNAISRFIAKFSVNFNEIYVWHYAYFVTFQLTGLCLYGIVKRWFRIWTAWAVLILFITQPLLWGHAFINPKDIPFMFFFILSVWTGYRLVDAFQNKPAVLMGEKVIRGFLSRWGPIDPRRKHFFLVGGGLVVLGLAISRGLVYSIIDVVLRFLYSAAPDSLAGSVMRNFAEHTSTIPVEGYIRKAQTFYARYDFILFVFGFLFIGGYLTVLLTDTSVIERMRNTLQQTGRKIRQFQFLDFFRQFGTALLMPKLIFAGVILGLATSVRILGPLAGLIVVAYLLIQIRQRSVPVILAYMLWTGVTVYLTWPFLWAAPIDNFLESLSVMSNFSWQGEVLFNGEFYTAATVPKTYLPVLLNLQFTEILIILGYLGLGIFIWQLFRGELRADLLLYIGFGFFFPIIYLIVSGSPLYDNFRQLLFLIPAMFLLSAFFVDRLFRKIGQNWLRALLIFIFVIPGLISSVNLHPYQYIYYNSIIGGVNGAFRRFELDYWLTSMNELTAWTNENADIGAKIVVKAAPDFMAQQLRPDIIVKKMRPSELETSDEFDYAILTTRWNSDEYFPGAEITTLVKRKSALLGVVKVLKVPKLE